MTKEEVKAGLLACAQKLGRTPKYEEVRQMTRISRFWVQKYFTTLSHALREAGVDPQGSGHRVETQALLEDWAMTARRLQKLPSLTEYRKEGRYSIRPFYDRCGGWTGVPEVFRNWCRQMESGEKWEDVLTLVSRREQQIAENGFRMPEMNEGAVLKDDGRQRRKIKLDRPVFGPPMGMLSPVPGMVYEPVNEQGTVFVFGHVAERLGLWVERIQSEFPDCEVMREVAPGRWQRLRVEIEYESRNYAKHAHPLGGCDMIVCWIHNWPECPIEVIELRSVIMAQK